MISSVSSRGVDIIFPKYNFQDHVFLVRERESPSLEFLELFKRFALGMNVDLQRSTSMDFSLAPSCVKFLFSFVFLFNDWISIQHFELLNCILISCFMSQSYFLLFSHLYFWFHVYIICVLGTRTSKQSQGRHSIEGGEG